jgi:hypothetical protein
MQHPNYPEALRFGCICAGHMEEDLIGARRREAAFKSERQRRARWLRRTWRVSARGNEYLNDDGFNVVVFVRGPFWSARVENHEERSGFEHQFFPITRAAFRDLTGSLVGTPIESKHLAPLNIRREDQQRPFVAAAIREPPLRRYGDRLGTEAPLARAWTSG